MIYDLFNQPIVYSVHRNSPAESNQQLQDNRLHFEGQTKIVLQQLLSGRRITGAMMYEEFKIQDVRARIFTLRKNNIDVKHESIKGGHGAREFYLEKEEIGRVNNLLKEAVKEGV